MVRRLKDKAHSSPRMADVLKGPVTVVTTAAYVDALVVRKLSQVKQVTIRLLETGGENAATYKICGRNSVDGSDDGEDFDLPKDEGLESESTEFTLAASANVREVVEENHLWFVVKVKDAAEGDHATVKLKAVGG